MINNFELIKSLFYFERTDNMFFHCQIVQRAKDHKSKKVREGAIKTYFVRSKEHLENLKEEIILLCEHYGARAYINVAGKDFDAMQNLMLMKLAKNVTENIIQNPRRILNSSAGELKSKKPKWIIDIDDLSIKDSIVKWLDNYFKNDEHLIIPSTYIYDEVPTVQGCHLIVIPFNLMKFHEDFPDIDIHKNSMGTLLYYPNSLKQSKYCCDECGSTNIEKIGWIDINTNKYKEDLLEKNKCWCDKCMKYTKPKEI